MAFSPIGLQSNTWPRLVIGENRVPVGSFFLEVDSKDHLHREDEDKRIYCVRANVFFSLFLMRFFCSKPLHMNNEKEKQKRENLFAKTHNPFLFVQPFYFTFAFQFCVFMFYEKKQMFLSVSFFVGGRQGGLRVAGHRKSVPGWILGGASLRYQCSRQRQGTPLRRRKVCCL